MYLTFKSLIHCIFVSGIISWSSFILLHVTIHFFPKHHLLKRLFFSSWVLYTALSSISWPYIIWVYFSVLYSIQWAYVSIFMLVTCCFDYYSYFEYYSNIVWSQEVWFLQVCSLSRCLMLFRIAFGPIQITGLFYLVLWKLSLECW